MPYKFKSVFALTMCLFCFLLKAPAFAGTTTYVYDELNRIKEVRHADGNGVRYDYDEIGNLKGKTPFGNVHTITASASEGGMITPMGTLTVTAGSSKGYSVTPLYGYSIVDVLVDGVSVGAVSSYSFSNVSASHTIAAAFATNSVAWVQGSVKDAANNPIAGVDVRIRNDDASFTAFVKTASDGTYRLAAYAGSWLVDALTENANWSPVTEQGVTLTSGQTATVNFMADIPSPILSTTALGEGIYITPYSQTLSATGGVTPYTWSITAGTLPAGLSLNNATGVISGTPESVGASNLTVQVRGANGYSTSGNLALTVSYLPVVIPGAAPTYFSSLQAAYNAAPDGATILCRGVELTESLAFNLNKTVTIIGGYDPLYATSSGVTTIRGGASLTAGAVHMQSINLQY